MSKLVREYLRDTVLSLSDGISFSYARESDFNAIKDKRYPAVLLRPLDYKPEYTLYTINRSYNATLLFYCLDSMQGTELETQSALDSCEDLVSTFLAKVNLASPDNDDDSSSRLTVISDRVVISNIHVSPRIKFTADNVTGYQVDFIISVPDITNPCNVYS